MLTKANTGSV